MSETGLVQLLFAPKAHVGNSASPSELNDLIVKGLPKDAIDRVKHAIRLTDPEMAALLGMSSKSVSRLRGKSRRALGLNESDRLYRIARIFSFAEEVLEDEELARQWLHAPQVGLGDRVPLDLLRTEVGAREVEDLLGQLEHGVLP